MKCVAVVKECIRTATIAPYHTSGRAPVWGCMCLHRTTSKCTCCIKEMMPQRTSVDEDDVVGAEKIDAVIADGGVHDQDASFRIGLVGLGLKSCKLGGVF